MQHRDVTVDRRLCLYSALVLYLKTTQSIASTLEESRILVTDDRNPCFILSFDSVCCNFAPYFLSVVFQIAAELTISHESM